MPNILRQFKKAEPLPEVNPIFDRYVSPDVIDSHDPRELTSVAGSWDPSDSLDDPITVEVFHA